MGFDACHPAVNFIFFAAVLYGSATFRHPVFLAIAYLCAFAYSVKRRGKRAAIFNLCLLPLGGGLCPVLQFLPPFRCHSPEKKLCGQQHDPGKPGVRPGDWSAVCHGVYVAGIYVPVMSSDKVVYLFGKISPLLSLFLTILLRLIPRIGLETRRINLAQKGIGKGSNQGTIFQRFVNCLRIFSMLITWMISALALESDSMRSVEACCEAGRLSQFTALTIGTAPL